MLIFFAAPDGMFPPNWAPTYRDIEYVRAGLTELDRFDLGNEAELHELNGMLETPLAPLVPQANGELKYSTSAQVTGDQQVTLLSEIAAGPWRAVFSDGLISVVEQALKDAFARQDNLLIVRSIGPI